MWHLTHARSFQGTSWMDFTPWTNALGKKVLSQTNGTTYISWALFGSYSPCSQLRPHRSSTSSERGWRHAARLQGVRVEVHVMRASSRCARGGARDELVERALLKSWWPRALKDRWLSAADWRVPRYARQKIRCADHLFGTGRKQLKIFVLSSNKWRMTLAGLGQQAVWVHGILLTRGPVIKCPSKCPSISTHAIFWRHRVNAQSVHKDL